MSIPAQSSESTTPSAPPRQIHKLVGACLLIAVLLWGGFGSGDISVFCDINVMIWVIGITLAGLWMCYGPMVVIQTIRHTLLGGDGLSPAETDQGIAVLGRAYQLAWAAGLSGFLLGLVIMLSNMDDPAAIGPGMAYSLLTTIYGLILAEFIFSPLQGVLISSANTHQPAEAGRGTAQRSMMPLGICIVLLACVSFFVLIVSLWPN